MKAAAFQQGLDALPQRRVGQGGELIEDRRDEGGIGPAHQDREAHQNGPGQQPPGIPGRVHHPENESQQRRADRQAQHGLQEDILGELAGCIAVETVTFLDNEGLIGAQRQFDKLDQQQRAQNDTHAASQG